MTAKQPRKPSKIKRAELGRLLLEEVSKAGRYDEEQALDLIHQGAELDQRNSDGYTPLLLALLYGQGKVAMALVRAGADMNVQNSNGYSPLISAVFHGLDLVAYELIRRGANLDLQNYSGYTALGSVTFSGNLEMATALIDAGADVNLPNNLGYTPLMHAVGGGYYELAKRLIIAGADKTRTNHQRHSASDMAARAPEMSKLLSMSREEVVTMDREQHLDSGMPSRHDIRPTKPLVFKKRTPV